MKTINKLFGTPIEVVPCNCRVWILAVIKMNSKKKKKKSQKSPSAVILGVVEPILFLSFCTCSNDETSNTRMERGFGPRI